MHHPRLLTSLEHVFFAVSNKDFVRILGGKVSKLVDYDERRVWENIEHPVIEDIIIEKNEINTIISKLKEYSASLF